MNGWKIYSILVVHIACTIHFLLCTNENKWALDVHSRFTLFRIHINCPHQMFTFITGSFVTPAIPFTTKTSPSTDSHWPNYHWCHCILSFWASIDILVTMLSAKWCAHWTASIWIRLKISKWLSAKKSNREAWKSVLKGVVNYWYRCAGNRLLPVSPLSYWKHAIYRAWMWPDWPIHTLKSIYSTMDNASLRRKHMWRNEHSVRCSMRVLLSTFQQQRYVSIRIEWAMKNLHMQCDYSFNWSFSGVWR